MENISAIPLLRPAAMVLESSGAEGGVGKPAVGVGKPDVGVGKTVGGVGKPEAFSADEFAAAADDVLVASCCSATAADVVLVDVDDVVGVCVTAYWKWLSTNMVGVSRPPVGPEWTKLGFKVLGSKSRGFSEIAPAAAADEEAAAAAAEFAARC